MKFKKLQNSVYIDIRSHSAIQQKLIHFKSIVQFKKSYPSEENEENRANTRSTGGIQNTKRLMRQ